MEKWKSILILGLIILCLLPVYPISGYLHKQLRPRESGARFLGWTGAMLALVFVYTFLLVLLIKLIFPGA
ncbi:MAG: hypothetical protein ACO25B_00195 [Chitinophagaceae bacterium]